MPKCICGRKLKAPSGSAKPTGLDGILCPTCRKVKAACQCLPRSEGRLPN